MTINYKSFLSWLIILVVILTTIFFVLRYFSIEKNLKVLWPNGQEVLRAGETYQIKWQSRKIGKLGILLVKGDNPQETKWIAQDISAEKKKYDWQVFVWEKPGEDYRIAILEYPWQTGKETDYSDDFFTILGPQFAACDELSIEEEWPFVPSDFPDQKKVFITETSFTGNLEGLEGADKKCQEEADAKKFGGTWKAFLGDDTTLAFDRLDLKGIFVEARSSGELPEGKTCHRLLGKNFEEFFAKLSAPLLSNQAKFETNFLADLGKIWLGRINKESQRDCATILARYSISDMPRGYSFTTTCQNWKIGEGIVPGYSLSRGQEQEQELELPICYNPQGIRIDAIGLAGLASGFVGSEGAEIFNTSLGKSCDTYQKLLCIEQ